MFILLSLPIQSRTASKALLGFGSDAIVGRNLEDIYIYKMFFSKDYEECFEQKTTSYENISGYFFLNKYF